MARHIRRRRQRSKQTTSIIKHNVSAVIRTGCASLAGSVCCRDGPGGGAAVEASNIRLLSRPLLPRPLLSACLSRAQPGQGCDANPSTGGGVEEPMAASIAITEGGANARLCREPVIPLNNWCSSYKCCQLSCSLPRLKAFLYVTVSPLPFRQPSLWWRRHRRRRLALSLAYRRLRSPTAIGQPPARWKTCSARSRTASSSIR